MNRKARSKLASEAIELPEETVCSVRNPEQEVDHDDADNHHENHGDNLLDGCRQRNHGDDPPDESDDDKEDEQRNQE
jgi:hypothetical protein